ncbi:MAG: hypothetical protein GU343_01985, partial [Nanoarchaeota archaeon]|nr:hypothetical protein [Nanoarchaeota archaeon]
LNNFFKYSIDIKYEIIEIIVNIIKIVPRLIKLRKIYNIDKDNDGLNINVNGLIVLLYVEKEDKIINNKYDEKPKILDIYVILE